MSETPRGTADEVTLQGASAGLRLSRLLRGTPYNERVLFLDVALQAILASGVITFLNVYLIRLGAENWQVAAFSSFPALITIIFAIPVGIFVQSQCNLVRTANWGRFFFRSMIGLFALLPLLPPRVATYVLVGAYSLMAIPGSIGNVAIVTILGQATSVERRPRMLSVRFAVNGLAASIVGFIAGRWLNGSPYPLNYQLLFIGGFVAGMASIYALSRLRLDPQSVVASPRPRIKLNSLMKVIKDEPRFRRWSLAAGVFRLAMAMPQALYIIYKVRYLGASDAWIGVLILIENGLSVITYFLLGRIASHPRYSKYLWLSLLGMVAYPITMALARTPQMLVIPSLCSAVFGAGMNVFMSNTLYKVLPQDQHATFIAADSLLANSAAFVAPMLGAVFADWLGINNAILLIAGFRAITAMLFWFLKVGTD
ncbi:MAG: MFS transporter [Anaerolineae bacterium]